MFLEGLSEILVFQLKKSKGNGLSLFTSNSNRKIFLLNFFLNYECIKSLSRSTKKDFCIAVQCVYKHLSICLLFFRRQIENSAHYFTYLKNGKKSHTWYIYVSFRKIHNTFYMTCNLYNFRKDTKTIFLTRKFVFQKHII